MEAITWTFLWHRSWKGITGDVNWTLQYYIRREKPIKIEACNFYGSWASVYGNHDVGPNVKREEIYSAEVKYNLSYTQHSPSGVAGVTNYFLPIYAHGTGESSRNPTEEYPIMIWWFFDTRGGKDATGSIPEHMDCTAVSWFQRENQRMIDEWGPLPSLAFMHIPT